MKETNYDFQFGLAKEYARETAKPFLRTLIRLDVIQHEPGRNSTNRRDQTILLNRLIGYWLKDIYVKTQ